MCILWTVESGETLSSIASQCRLSLVELIKLNPQFGTLGFRDPNIIFVGERIVTSFGKF